MCDIPEMDPLEAVHEIRRMTYQLQVYASALQTLGIPAGQDLDELARSFDTLARAAANGICRDANERYHEALAQTGDLVVKALDYHLNSAVQATSKAG